MTDLAQPHDRLFKALVSHPETAGALLREYLPKEIVALLAPGNPEPVPGTFVSQELQPYYSDMLFCSKTLSGRSLFFYTLMEHKSYPDRKVGWQLFRGCSRFMDQYERKNPEWTLLPAIVPFVLYHGAQTWTISKNFSELLDADDALRPWLVNFPFIVSDLGPIPDDRLARHARLKAVLMALKYGTRDPREQMAAMETIISALMEAPDLLIPILTYLFATFQHLDQDAVEGIVVRVCPQEAIKMMSVFAREIVEQHKHTWLQDGEQKGRAETLTRQLQRRFGAVPDWASEKISKATSQSLEEWSLRFVDAQSLEDVFADRM
ncbi:MAG: Rpn family recombination-promoting nuclease/putative transposase [Magnetococcales bacterium]|nr:Rpn family recombination-promoting nuclease/putative transposase [Magnetococcales bacterium]